MIQLLRLFGILPNMLELTVNPCTQGCSYCYAKQWKREFYKPEQVINNILHHEAKNDTLLSFLIKQRQCITISNRSDITCLKNWPDYILPLKEMGFPIYMETKLHNDYQRIPDILDKGIDHLYITITGRGKKYEEKNCLSGEERIEAARWLVKKGFGITLAVNPYFPDKITIKEIKELIKYIKPEAFVMFPYHTTSIVKDRKHFMKEYDFGTIKEDFKEMIRFCEKKEIPYEIYHAEFLKNRNKDFDWPIVVNKRFYDGNQFLFRELKYRAYQDFKKYDFGLVQLEDCATIFKKQFQFYKDCIFDTYEFRSRYEKFEGYPRKIEIKTLFKYLWNNTSKMLTVLDKVIDLKDDNGNIIYGRSKNDVWEA
jgi:DNA repair photolyase